MHRQFFAMRHALLALALLAASAKAKANPDMDAVRNTFEIYSDCVGVAVERYATSSASPTEVLDAAEGSCVVEFGELRDALYDGYMNILHDEAESFERASHMADTKKATVRSWSMAILLDLRMKPAK
jgi:hypothetical protein